VILLEQDSHADTEKKVACEGYTNSCDGGASIELLLVTSCHLCDEEDGQECEIEEQKIGSEEDRSPLVAQTRLSVLLLAPLNPHGARRPVVVE